MVCYIMLSIIAVINNNYVIGKNNKLIWNIPNDLKRFRNITVNKTIIMGRKTFESLPKVLPDRKSIVITRNKQYFINDKRIIILHDIKQILKYKNFSEEAFVIGGGEIYKQLIAYCKRLYLTKVESAEYGDVYFPKFKKSEYKIIYKKDNVENNLKYSFITLEKIDSI